MATELEEFRMRLVEQLREAGYAGDALVAEAKQVEAYILEQPAKDAGITIELKVHNPRHDASTDEVLRPIVWILSQRDEPRFLVRIEALHPRYPTECGEWSILGSDSDIMVDQVRRVVVSQDFAEVATAARELLDDMVKLGALADKADEIRARRPEAEAHS